MLTLQTAIAETQVAGPIAFISAGAASQFSLLPVTSADEQVISIDTSSASFVDWNEPGSEFLTTCGVYLLGNAIVVNISTNAGKQIYALSASANAARQNLIVKYHVDGTKCVADALLIAGE